jgi:hypothetical protein
MTAGDYRHRFSVQLVFSLSPSILFQNQLLSVLFHLKRPAFLKSRICGFSKSFLELLPKQAPMLVNLVYFIYIYIYIYNLPLMVADPASSFYDIKISKKFSIHII